MRHFYSLMKHPTDNSTMYEQQRNQQNPIFYYRNSKRNNLKWSKIEGEWKGSGLSGIHIRKTGRQEMAEKRRCTKWAVQLYNSTYDFLTLYSQSQLVEHNALASDWVSIEKSLLDSSVRTPHQIRQPPPRVVLLRTQYSYMYPYMYTTSTNGSKGIDKYIVSLIKVPTGNYARLDRCIC